jgi:peptidoglycan-associated lipoprotein
VNRYLLLPFVALVACKGCGPEPVTDPRVEEPPPPVQDAPKKEVPPVVQEMVKNFNRVFFDFDAATLNADSKSALDANAAILAQYPDVRFEIQGNADERGTTEYNLALGQKRADAVVQYLLAKGVASSRVKSVSYGEERPLDGRSTETAWAQNRRAEFVITWSGDAPVKGTTD